MPPDLSLDPWEVQADDYPEDGTWEERVTFFLRYAVLAPSSHNTQPWRFQLEEPAVHLFADLSGWLEVADPDKRELYLSLGCALENLVIAARRFGLRPDVTWGPGGEGRPEATVVLREGASGVEGEAAATPYDEADLFRAITQRHTNHGAYRDEPVPEEIRRRLASVTAGGEVEVHFTDDPGVRERVDALTVRADALQFADPAWRKELGHWLGKGVFGQGWILSKMAKLAVSHLDMGGTTGKKDRELLDSAALLGLVAAPERSRVAALEAGRVFQRLFLAATAEGLALQPMNQILQVDEVREAFVDLLPDEWGTPLITFRMGYAEAEDHTPRKPLEDVLLIG